jgi:DNA-binding transcriptional MocR family regulator
MSPAQVLERSYHAFKTALLKGLYRPGQRLDAAGIASDLDVSVTPIREILARLTGEGLVDAVAGDGFHVPLLTEDDLRDLYAWTQHLLLLATRRLTPLASPATDHPPASDDIAEATARLFDRAARASGNREVAAAIGRANDRLQVVRRIEPMLIGLAGDELDAIEASLSLGDTGTFARRVRTYHARRLRRVADLVRMHRETGPS